MKTLYLIALIVLTSCFVGEELPSDQKAWGYAKPDDEGFSTENFLNLNDLIENDEFDDILSLIVIKNNNIIFENYYDDSFRNELRPIGIMTQIVTIALLGSIIEDGYINNLDEPIHNYLPFYSNVFDAQPEKKEITIRHLLDNKSGFVWNESLSSYLNENNDINRMKNFSSDYGEYVIKKDIEAIPGLRLVINSGTGTLLARIMQYAIGDIDLKEYADQKIFIPLGIKDYEWLSDPEGNLDGSTGLYLKDIDIAKIGFLFLNYGSLNRNRILDEDWAFDMTSTQSIPSNNYSIGYGWRLATGALAGFLGFENNEVLYTPLHHGQVIIIVPSENLMLAVYAENYFSGFADRSFQIFAQLFQTTEAN